MKKEYLIVVVLILFILSSVLDSLAGPIKLTLKTPFSFLKPEILSVYPLTTVGIGAKALFVSLSLLLGLSLIEGQYLGKGLSLVFFAVLSELYSIQQIATNSKVTPLEWNLAFATIGIVLLLPAVLFIIFGAAKNVHHKLTKTVEAETPTPQE